MSQILASGSGGGGGGGALNTLSGSAGGAVNPSVGGNIGLINGTNITTTGIPGAHTIGFSLVDSPTCAGTITGLTLRTSAAAAYTTVTGNALSVAGTDADINFGITTKGAGTFNVTTPSGGMIFRGINAGWASTEWRTQQHTTQTANAVPTVILSIPLVNNLMVSVKALINGFQDDYSDSVGGEILVTAYRAAAGNIILVGAPIINVNYSNPVDTSDIDAGINVGTQSLEIKVIGVAAQNWNWVSTISFMYTISNA